MTNKELQNLANMECDREYASALAEVYTGNYTVERLRTCTASVLETANYWVLRSYNTLVAVTNKNTGVCYDLLRRVYGYTATSAQHISKFAHDYHLSSDKWGAQHITWR